jgi:hypothetical protein
MALRETPERKLIAEAWQAHKRQFKLLALDKVVGDFLAEVIMQVKLAEGYDTATRNMIAAGIEEAIEEHNLV